MKHWWIDTAAVEPFIVCHNSMWLSLLLPGSPKWTANNTKRFVWLLFKTTSLLISHNQFVFTPTLLEWLNIYVYNLLLQYMSRENQRSVTTVVGWVQAFFKKITNIPMFVVIIPNALGKSWRNFYSRTTLKPGRLRVKNFI